MAATERSLTGGWGAIALAACALPGVMPGAAQAEEAPEQGVVALKMSSYQDRQPGMDRLTVRSPSAYLLLPLGRQWSVEGSVTHDDVSGASPRYYTDVSGASRMSDDRKAGDLRLTRYFERSTLSVGASHSDEHDYVSNALSVGGTLASEDHNTTWTWGVGYASDRINPVNDIVSDETRRTSEWMLGLTQALTPGDIVQATLTFSHGQGDYSDPYKLFDHRPRLRNAGIALLRWNHWLPELGGAARLSYRYYGDTFGIRSHTVELALDKPLAPGWVMTPTVRYYSQRAARFYVDPVADPAQYPAPWGSPTYSSTDQRMAAFGSLGLGMKLAWEVQPRWTVDLRAERYEQRSDWRLGGQGSPGLDSLTATEWQLGLSHRF